MFNSPLKSLKSVAVLVMVLLAARSYGQTNQTALQVLNNIYADAADGGAPLNLYPQSLLDDLQAMGDNQYPPARVKATVTSETLQSKAMALPMGDPQPLPPTYVLIDLGTLGGVSSEAWGINSAGQVVGDRNLNYNTTRAFFWQNGLMQDLDQSSHSTARDINSAGQVVGGNGYAFLWQNGTMQGLGIPGDNGSQANSINSQGQIAGWAFLNQGPKHGFLWQNGSMQDLGTLGGSSSEALGINSSGQVVGDSDTVQGNEHAFLWQNGSMQDLGTFGGLFSVANGINSSGLIAGWASTSLGDNHAFFWQNGSMQDLGTLGGLNSQSYGINSQGQTVGWAAVSGNKSHAFLWQNGTMYDLNDLLFNTSSGWVLQAATAINDNGQICGFGANPQGQMHAFLLKPLPEWNAEVSTMPAQKSYGNFPVKQSGKDSLVVITHGWNNRFLSPFVPGDAPWVDVMSDDIVASLNSHGVNNWQVFGYKWLNNAWTFTAPDALNNAKQEGVNLGSAIAVQGWSQVHLIGHSAGAEVIQIAAEWIKAVSPTTVVQCTFLDPYVGNDNAGIGNYGSGSDWSDCYFSHDVTGDVTEQPLVNAYNVDVTQLGPKIGISKFRSQTTGLMEPCTTTIKYHDWPIDFYINTITGNNVDSSYAGFGFPLSQESGGWISGKPGYVVGNGTVGHAEPVRRLGQSDPDCMSGIHLNPPVWSSFTPDFSGLPTHQSDTGSNQKGNGTLKLTPGSPSWVATVITFTNPINTVAFDAQFSGVTGSQDMLSVFWDSDTIGTVDERAVAPGLQHYSLQFTTAPAGSSHVISFRLDPFTNAMSSVVLTNVILSQTGPSVASVLSATTNVFDGLPIWQLTGEAGFAYGIQASTNIAETNWTDVAELLNTNGVVQFFDAACTNYPMRFYRAYVPAPK